MGNSGRKSGGGWSGKWKRGVEIKVREREGS